MVYVRVECDVKDLTILDIKRAIPPHCFESSMLLSLLFTVRSMCLSFALVLCFHICEVILRPHVAAWTALCGGYVYLQGLVFWGFFTIGHDCGHGAFSRYPFVNWVVGNVMHSIIFVPYEPWRLSHRSHHKNTCNIAKEEIFYPNEAWYHKFFFWTLGGAWFVYILAKNVPGRRSYLAYFQKEFVPVVGQLVGSFLSIAVSGYVLSSAIHAFGLSKVVMYYLAPLFVFACWLVIVTFLHHNDPTCPWYTEESWTLFKGSLSAVDRDYGMLANSIAHNINLHQIHHLFPIIPHYRLLEATIAFRRAFPSLSRIREGSIVMAFMMAARDWLFTRAYPDAEGVFLYGKSKTS